MPVRREEPIAQLDKLHVLFTWHYLPYVYNDERGVRNLITCETLHSGVRALLKSPISAEVLGL